MYNAFGNKNFSPLTYMASQPPMGEEKGKNKILQECTVFSSRLSPLTREDISSYEVYVCVAAAI